MQQMKPDAEMRKVKQSFDQMGFVVVENAVSIDRIMSMRRRMHGLVDELALHDFENKLIPTTYVDASFETRLVKLFHGRHMERRPWDDVAFCEELHSIVTAPQLLRALGAVLGPNFLVSGGYHVRSKLPFDTQTEVPWHQDCQYFGSKAVGVDIVTAWIPLVDATLENGCLAFVPGSHRMGLFEAVGEVSGRKRNVTVREDVESLGETVAVPVKMGDAVLFSSLTLHSSGPNTSQGVRWNVDVRYISDASKGALDQETSAFRYYMDERRKQGSSVLKLREDGCSDTWGEWQMAQREIDLKTER